MNDGVGVSFGCGARLICEVFLDWLIVLEVVAWVQWHLLILPSDFCFVKVDIHSSLTDEDSSDNEIMAKGMFVDNAFHSFALTSQ